MATRRVGHDKSDFKAAAYLVSQRATVAEAAKRKALAALQRVNDKLRREGAALATVDVAALSATAEMARKQAVGKESLAFAARARLETKVIELEAAAAHAEPSIDAATRLGNEADATTNQAVAARLELAAALHAANEARTAAAAKQEVAKAAEKEYGLVALRAKRVREKALKSLTKARKLP